MRGRNRNKTHHSSGGGGGGGGGGHHHHNPLTRVYESNGQDVKIRGTAHHIAEKYLQLARDAQGSGDPVTAENHFQHAEHYSRLIATAQEQFRAQNPYYQAPPAPGTTTDEAFDGEEGEDGQPAQQGQPQNFNQGQPNFSGQQDFNQPPQQPSYPPREQPQPYGSQQSNYQPRPQQHQPYNNNHQQPQQPQQQQPQQQQPQQYQPQPSQNEGGDAGQLPSFITGGQPQPAQQNLGQNGQDNNQSGDRFPRHRRRRHRGPGGPRPEMGGQQDFRGEEGPPEPGNS